MLYTKKCKVQLCAGLKLCSCDCSFCSCRECAGQSEEMRKLVPDMEGADPMAAGLLIECRGQTPEDKDVRH